MHEVVRFVCASVFSIHAAYPYNKACMPPVFVVGRDWPSRALIRAQLLEEGVDVEAHETARDALNTVTDLRNLPELLLADLHLSPCPEAEIDLLTRWAGAIPVWVITDRTLRIDRSLKGAGIERVLARPVDVKQLVADIKQRLRR